MTEWPHETWPIEGGGHTYCGFYEVRKPRIFRKGIVRPDVPFNFNLIKDDIKQDIRKSFARLGYRLEIKYLTEE